MALSKKEEEIERHKRHMEWSKRCWKAEERTMVVVMLFCLYLVASLVLMAIHHVVCTPAWITIGIVLFVLIPILGLLEGVGRPHDFYDRDIGLPF